MFWDWGQILARWAVIDPSANPTLVNLSENHTFRIDAPNGARSILRVHRPGYHSLAGIRSELEWMEALRADTGLFTPRAIAGTNGDLVQSGPFQRADDLRFMVLFAFEDGEEPAVGDDLEPVFAQLGGLAARCHAHARKWTPPRWFERQRWTERAILDPEAIWGDWRAGPGVAGPLRSILDALDQRLRADLAAYGAEPDRFGLIHADMRLANLLVADGVTRLIDFDDCGYCWFGYDFAAGVSFFEDHPIVGALKARWLEGYRAIAEYPRADEDMLDALVLLRRMALLAWMGTHEEAQIAQDLAPVYAQGSAELAERYLTKGQITAD
ncbi:phosphotransferase enzyme family protein [Pelagibacterium montanilacus]|uniref:phosphotransferase enzyme family protein n=1 Tax=Pelagibacterium montanilacus TaxID=2185280 RepID=UPI000F8CFFE9|nr:phosphotransferase [Pelagibacterium montanilacus]